MTVVHEASWKANRRFHNQPPVVEHWTVHTIDFRHALEAPWTTMAPVIVGQVRQGVGDPSTYVTVQKDASPFLRVDIYESEPAAHAFQEALAWADFIVVGFGAQVHLVSSAARTPSTFALDGYFGHLYALDDCLLVADAERLRCIDKSGSLLWASVALGIDGVVVHSIREGIVEGEGDWDPPGGWRPFRLQLASGRVLPHG
ncbi:MAG: hypothetical protein HY898_17840 [Deltaproteobacteria bacterium]|nr:hypothetical protein [Deltaproteobacteria bacterium]